MCRSDEESLPGAPAMSRIRLPFSTGVTILAGGLILSAIYLISREDESTTDSATAKSDKRSPPVSREEAAAARTLAIELKQRHRTEGVLAIWPDLQRLVKLDPTYADGRVLMATAAAEMRRFSEARAHCDAGLELFPESEKLLKLAARIAFEQGDHAGCVGYIEGIRRWRGVPASEWTDRRLLYMQAICAKMAGVGQSAETCLKRLVELDPKSARWHRLLASLLFDLGRFGQALGTNAILIGLEPRWQAFERGGLCAERLGRHDEALRSYERAGAGGQPPHQNAVARARCLSEIGTPEALESAWALLEPLVKVNSPPTAMLLSASRLQRRRGRLEAARRFQTRYDIASKREAQAADAVIPVKDRFLADPKNVEAGLAVIQAYLDRQDLAAALSMARLLTRFNPIRLEGPYRLGELLMLSGETQGAFWEGMKIRDRAPDDERGWALLCWSLHERGKIEDAVRYGEKVLELNPSHGRTIAILAKAYPELGPSHASRAAEMIALRDAIKSGNK